jgi:hypothetical protein
MARTTIIMPDGLSDKARKHGLCISQIAAKAVLSELVSRVEQEKKTGLSKEVKKSC